MSKGGLFLLWGLSTQAGLSFSDVIVVQKSYSGDWLSLLLQKRTEKIFFLALTFIFDSNTLCLRLLHITTFLNNYDVGSRKLIACNKLHNRYTIIFDAEQYCGDYLSQHYLHNCLHRKLILWLWFKKTFISGQRKGQRDK